MDFLDFFENMGLGMGIVVVLFVIMLLITVAGTIFPVLLALLATLAYVLIPLIAFGAVVYFIGKFTKGFIK